MNDIKEHIHIMVDSIDNPKILENLNLLIEEYINYYSIPQQKNEAS